MGQSTLQTFVNGTQSLVWLKRIGPDGKEARVKVQGGSKIDLTADEVRFNEAAYATDAGNPFRNGMLKSLVVVQTGADLDSLTDDDEPDDELGESEMADLLRSSIRDLQGQVATITNAGTLRRLHEIGKANGTNDKKLGVIADRLRSVDPSALLASDPSAGQVPPAGGPDTPASTQAPSTATVAAAGGGSGAEGGDDGE